ncbi:DUF3221 domain-containing protein [Ornithinibacillus gellani]|uniref:DUF3221 domain-containing protein n=1 Tax=Ornithinibacillus gellani TaxID=2293253 RepID=UPI000F4834B7|nr:DUF3221 domain-containing protein [Ornithinibacillus gellani]TQS74245.1 DUF3221 domain-containing protein [Ornithinibacillus gellani]
MKKAFQLIIILLLASFLSGCGMNNSSGDQVTEIDHQMEEKLGKPDIYGYVMDKQDERILVVSHEPEDFRATGGVAEFHNAIWVSHMPKTIQTGQKIKMWFSAVAESYPAQAAGGKYMLIEEPKPAGAHLTEADALQQALQQLKIDEGIPTVTSILYESDTWEVTIKHLMQDDADDQESIIYINDK